VKVRSATVAALAALVGGLLAATASGRPNPRTLTLRLADMPSGFSVKTAHYVGAVAAAGSGSATEAQYRAWGYMAGYEADFAQRGSLSDLLKGAVEIDSSVSVYETAHGAAESWADSKVYCAEHTSVCLRLSLGKKIGSQAGLYKLTPPSSGGVKTVVYSVVWHRGPLRAAVLATGAAAGVGPSLSEVIALAVKQDRRMAQALELRAGARRSSISP